MYFVWFCRLRLQDQARFITVAVRGGRGTPRINASSPSQRPVGIVARASSAKHSMMFLLMKTGFPSVFGGNGNHGNAGWARYVTTRKPAPSTHHNRQMKPASSPIPTATRNHIVT